MSVPSDWLQGTNALRYCINEWHNCYTVMLELYGSLGDIRKVDRLQLSTILFTQQACQSIDCTAVVRVRNSTVKECAYAMYSTIPSICMM